jgi:hypothetical protein
MCHETGANAVRSACCRATAAVEAAKTAGYDPAMQNLQSQVARILLLTLGVVSAPASAFEAIDTTPWPSLGGFPAYPPESAGQTAVWAQAGILRDDNVLRTETGPQSDNYARYGGGIRHESRLIGRQRVRFEARGDYYDYRNNNELDHFAYGLAGEWLWEIGNNWAGSVFLAQTKRQVDMAETQAARLDTAISQRLGATASYLISPGFRLRGGLLGTHDERSEGTDSETRTGTVTAAAEYVSRLANTVGLEYRYTNGNAPQLEFVVPLGAFVSNDYTEQELALVSSYALGSQLRASIRVGYTRRDYDEIPTRDFDGWTGRIGVDWFPGSKTALGFLLYHEPRSIIDISASHVVISGAAFAPRWAVTNQVVLHARFAREHRQFEGDPSLTAGATLQDEYITLVRFGVGWEPQRRWLVGLAAEHGERESNTAGRDYQYTSVMANLGYRW